MECAPLAGASYYERYYANYAAQNPAYKLRYYRDLACRYIPESTSSSVVDVGCAFGDFLGILPAEWKRCGVDTNAFAIDSARERFPEIAFERIGRFSIPREGLDAVTAFDVLEHVPDLGGALDAVNAALARGGILVLVVPVYDGPLGALVRALDKDPTHVHKRSRGFWRETIERKFDVLHYEGVFRYLFPGVQRYAHFHGAALASVSPAVAIVARKKA